ncbi:MAG: hypothetical protein NXH97_00145 [Rhodobacteraceae bacterium]|nr:hypothetical protein [Paracoccaceae bacterium]
MRYLLVVFLALAACTDTRLPVTNGRILTAEQFQVTAAGKLFTTRDLELAIRPNGTFSGRENGQDIAGTWTFANGQLCATRTAPAPTPTDCQIWTVRGNSFTVTRNGGRGPSTTYVARFPIPPSYEQRVGLAG